MSDVFSTTIGQQSLSGRAAVEDSKYTDMESKLSAMFNHEFFKQEVAKALAALQAQDAETCYAQASQKLDIVNGDGCELTEQISSHSLVSSLTMPSHSIEKAKMCVTKLIEDTHGFLGTFIHIYPNIGICAFHSVEVRRKIYDGSTLKIAGGHVLRHLASYPYYDLSVFEVVGAQEISYFELAPNSAVRVGRKVFAAAFPELDANSSESFKEEVLVAPGNIVRVQSTIDSPFVAANYACCGGSSGGAILDKDGELLGMHVHNLYRLESYYLKSGMSETRFPEDYFIKAPARDVRTFIKSNEERMFKGMDALSLARHAANNISEKSSFGCFLPISIIKNKLQSCLMWTAENSPMEQ